jgi:hypothetical protein
MNPNYKGVFNINSRRSLSSDVSYMMKNEQYFDARLNNAYDEPQYDMVEP